MKDLENPQPRRVFVVRRVRIYQDQLDKFAKIQEASGIDFNKFLRAALENHLEKCKNISE